MRAKLLWGLAAVAALGISPPVKAQEAVKETVRIAYVDPLSGGGAGVGERGLKTFQFIADQRGHRL
jgi:branched-chain amino acid transport system substrate-binding protein